MIFREEPVHVLGFDVSEEELKDGLTASTQRYWTLMLKQLFDQQQMMWFCLKVYFIYQAKCITVPAFNFFQCEPLLLH